MEDLGWRLFESVKMAAEESAVLNGEERTKSEENFENADKLLFNAQECPVETVVVYLDRAEVCRSVRTRPTKGENEVIIKNLSPSIDKDSIRVESHGPAIIQEVTIASKFLTEDGQAHGNKAQADLQTQVTEARRRRDILETKKHRLKKQRDVLDGFADNVMHAGGDGKSSQQKSASLDAGMLEGMKGFFDLYEKQAARLDSSLHELELEIEKNEEHIRVLEQNIIAQDSAPDDIQARELSVLMDVKDDKEVILSISYVVSKAKWSPKYDIRVFSNEGQMKILYYGIIQQATSENWDDAKLCLSTAMPSIGGTVPDLGTQKLHFKQKSLEPGVTSEMDVSRRGNARAFGSMKRKKRLNSAPNQFDLSKSFDEALCQLDLDKWCREGEGEDIQDVPMEVKESITSTMYEISRRSTIPCDNSGHKVSVAIIDLSPTFEYECVPKKSAHAYLKAKVKNTSSYALLAGPTNIFLDNNFIAKAELKAVSPSEDFTCSLGVDPGVRVVYRPLHKYREQSGIVSKTVSTTYKQTTEIKNTHRETIKICVMDHLPMSTEEKIKVTLVEPQVKHSDKDKNKPVRINKLNNLQWDLQIASGETKELTTKYAIEHPVTEEVETNILHYTNESVV